MSSSPLYGQVQTFETAKVLGAESIAVLSKPRHMQPLSS